MSAETEVNLVSERVVRILADVLNIALDEIHPGSRMLYDLGASSIYITELVAVFQRQFRIELTYIEVERCETVAELVSLVEARAKAIQDP
jgi:acyl carrier protein